MLNRKPKQCCISLPVFFTAGQQRKGSVVQHGRTWERLTTLLEVSVQRREFRKLTTGSLTKFSAGSSGIFCTRGWMRLYSREANNFHTDVSDPQGVATSMGLLTHTSTHCPPGNKSHSNDFEQNVLYRKYNSRLQAGHTATSLRLSQLLVKGIRALETP